ncbi:hypothetical protein GCM10027413_31890 [Conyzicola nivalis]|uniref:Prepilin-type N-terminal cleavage/methylation domain-containing protein n=2 Tax=Conyzicola nivalis TaxID=1477021 RepID=A0A916WLK4_9MICO|nr:hypothetical protein GCM10010979_27630 [Conyzicola nivalis]
MRQRAAGTPAAAHHDAGLSLVELLVSIMLSALLLVLVGTTFVQVVRNTGTVTAAREGAGSASSIVTELSKVIRSASTIPATSLAAAQPAVVSATDNALTVYSYVDTSPTVPKPTKVEFAIVAGQIVEKRWATTSTKSPWVFPSTPTSTVTYPGIHAPIGSTPLFTYLDATDTPVSPGAGLSETQRALVASITVSVRIRPATPATAKPVEIVNTVGMPNVGIERATP